MLNTKQKIGNSGEPIAVGDVEKAALNFAKWLEENTDIIYKDNIPLYKYCESNNELTDYTLEDIFKKWQAKQQPINNNEGKQ